MKHPAAKPSTKRTKEKRKNKKTKTIAPRRMMKKQSEPKVSKMNNPDQNKVLRTGRAPGRLGNGPRKRKRRGTQRTGTAWKRGWARLLASASPFPSSQLPSVAYPWPPHTQEETKGYKGARETGKKGEWRNKNREWWSSGNKEETLSAAV